MLMFLNRCVFMSFRLLFILFLLVIAELKESLDELLLFYLDTSSYTVSCIFRSLLVGIVLSELITKAITLM